MSTICPFTFRHVRQYVGEMNRSPKKTTSSFQNAEWNGATVLAGAAAEALLMWSISNTNSLNG
jgi:hypothetical protein